MVRELGPLIEAKYWPVYRSWTVTEIERSDDRICWTVVFDKLRPISAEQVFYRLTDKDGNSQSFIPFLTETGSPINKRASERSVGPNQKSQRCTDLPKWVEPNEPITIAGHFIFRGWMNLWQTEWDTGIIKNP
jgi:hypothetical protein